MKKFFKQLSEYGLYMSIIFLLANAFLYLISMLFKMNVTIAAVPLTLLILLEFVLTKDFMDIKVMRTSYRLTVASAIFGMNALVIGFCFSPSLGKFGNVLALFSSVIIPIFVVVSILIPQNKTMINTFLDTKV